MAPEALRRYLADTNVLSNRSKVEGDPNLIAWLRNAGGRVRVVTLAEMRRGPILLEARVATRKDRTVVHRERDRLARKRAWYDAIVGQFADRIEPIDIAVAERWAEISVRFPSLRDGDKAIAATALPKAMVSLLRTWVTFAGPGWRW